MDILTEEIVGTWIQTIGTVLSAIGSTPSLGIGSERQKDLNVWGNALQAVGNALSADAQKTITLGKIGNEIQSIGNSLVIAGLVIDFKEETKLRSIIMGNWLQALGGGAAVGDELQGTTSNGTDSAILNVNGNLLQSIGNSLQAIAATQQLQGLINIWQTTSHSHKTNQKNNHLEIIGSWIQAVGAVLVLLGQLIEG